MELAQDRRTHFPCLRLDGEEMFVSLFPVTKLQVEQWIIDGGLATETPEKASNLIDQLEVKEVTLGYPDEVRLMRRVPISDLNADNLSSLIATNLSVWCSADEVLRRNGEFPTPNSLWGRFIDWIGGTIPSKEVWEYTQDQLSTFQTKNLLERLRESGQRWQPSVEKLLTVFENCIDRQKAGLPLMQDGLYELLSDTRNLPYLHSNPGHGDGRSDMTTFPCIIGNSSIWPVLEASGRSEPRALLHPMLPVVAVRLWFNPNDVVNVRQINGILPVICSAEDKPQLVTANARPRQNVRVHHRNTMQYICPICYMRVDPAVFLANGALWCWEEAVDAGSLPEQGNLSAQTMASQKLERKHANRQPATDPRIRNLEVVHEEYRAVAKSTPNLIKSVTVGGFTKSGKTTWMLGLTGMIYYPHEQPIFGSAFPQDWVNRILCKTTDLREEAGIRRLMEDMWVMGYLPPRTSTPEALRYPMKFSLTPGFRPWNLLRWGKTRQQVCILNDIAGEDLNDPIGLARKAERPYKNLGATTDLIFLVPAHNIELGSVWLNQFANGLQAINFNSAAVQPSEINLILAISQIDRLLCPSSRNDELLDIFLRQPYTWPTQQNKRALHEYIQTMQSIDSDLERWVATHAMGLRQEVGRFRSVRYCGFSSFGFQPLPERNISGVDSRLPFEPQPVRAVDPLLWLLLDSGWMKPGQDLGN